MYKQLLLLSIVGLLPFLIIGGCSSSGGGGGGSCPETNTSIQACDPVTGGPFSLDGANEFFPLVVGNESVLEGADVDDEGEEVEIRIESTVLDETEMVAGVETRVVEDCNPLDKGVRDEKVYVSGIGTAKDENAVLISFEEGM